MTKVHRIGLTQISASDPAPGSHYQVNVVFVHGLRGHPQGTWEVDLKASDSDERHETPNKRKSLGDILKLKRLSKKHDTNHDIICSTNQVFWPADFLDHDLPVARIWTYGYNADVIGMFEANNKNSVSQHGRDLFVQLERDIQNEDPFIFVVHSLGGIILKDALRRSPQVCSRTRSVIFLGTPHRGSDLAAWGAIASKLAKLALQDSNNRILDTLKVNGEIFDNIQEGFQGIVLRGGIKIHSLQEARGISGVKGLSGKVVDDFSSKLGLGEPFETVQTIDANHMQMARCRTKDDIQYRTILAVLRQLIREGLHTEQMNKSRTQPIHAGDMRDEAARPELRRSSDISSPPSYHIQLDENIRFVGRTTVLRELQERLFVRTDCRKIALVGLGGVGKTQVALQFAYRMKEQYTEYSIFWVAALSSSTFEQAFTSIARQLGLQETSDDDVEETLCQYLSSAKAGKWLMIIDNADDAALMFGSATKAGIAKFLPSNNQGLILLTTRSREVAVDFAQSNVIDVEKLDPEEATDFLRKSLVQQDVLQDKSLVTSLLDSLAYLPLAIAQAAAFLNQTKTTIGRYLELLTGAESEMTKLLSREFRDGTRYEGSYNAVARTWVVSFEQIQKSNEMAADLLAFLSCIEPKAIPQSILPDSQSFDTESAVGVLCGYSFLGRRGDSDVFDMHSLVHVAARVWTEEQSRTQSVLEAAVRHLADIFPSSDRLNRDLWRAYLPHASRVLSRSKGYELEDRYSLVGGVGQCLKEDRRFQEAVVYYEEVCWWKQERLSEDDGSRLNSEHALASAYLNNRQIEKAIEILEHIVGIEKETLDEKDHDRLTSEHNLARAYLDNGQIEKAIEILEHVVRIRKETLDKKDHARLTSEHNLAKAYLDNGQIEKAIEILEHIVGIEKETLDKKDHARLTSEHTLAGAYLNNGQIEKAIEILEHIVGIEKETLDEKDHDRLISEHTLAGAYLDNRQIEKAIEILEHVVRIRKETLDKKDHARLTSEHELARAYLDNGQIEKAIEILEHVVAIESQLFDEGDPERDISVDLLRDAYDRSKAEWYIAETRSDDSEEDASSV